MTLCLACAIGCLVLAAIPGIVFIGNLNAFTRLSKSSVAGPPISVLIPARNEAASIAAAVSSVLASASVTVELIVLDDHSTDATAAIVTAIAQNDDRLRILPAPPLPAGWCGKQHACQVLASVARFDTLLWMDADVRLAPDALQRMAAQLSQSRADLISGFPFQQTITWLESLLIPLIHFILLGFLPIRQMRRSTSPSLGAGCGQLFMARRQAYFDAGGHAAIRASLHDGIALPRAFRKARKQTDIFDASDLAECRMYDSAGAVWNGLLKNAGEGIAAPAAIGPWTIFLLAGQVLPLPLALYLGSRGRSELAPALLAALAAAIGVIIRMISARRFYMPSAATAKYGSALAHPLGVLLLLLIQWQSVFRRLTGKRSKWKGRSY